MFSAFWIAAAIRIQDERIRNIALKLLKEEAKFFGWTMFLKQAEQRLREKILNAWAVKFFQEADRVMHYQPMHSDEELAERQEKLKTLFENNAPSWDKYLHQNGIVHFVSDLVGVDLVS